MTTIRSTSAFVIVIIGTRYVIIDVVTITSMWRQSARRELSRPSPTPPRSPRPRFHSPVVDDDCLDDDNDDDDDDDDDEGSVDNYDDCLDDDEDVDDDETLIFAHLSPTISGTVMSRFCLNFILFHLLEQ